MQIFVVFETFKYSTKYLNSHTNFCRAMSTLLFLAILFSTLPIASSKKCRTNNDCKIGRCEWRRCVGKVERVASGRQESPACYMDEDCDMSKGQVCHNGICGQREPFWGRVQKPAHWQCLVDSDCANNHACGMYKQCYDMNTNKYAVESMKHIPCINEEPNFCSKATGFPDATCRRFKNLTKIFYICQLPPPFEPATPKACATNGICQRYRTCVVNTCFDYFWLTVRERCKSDKQCNFDTKCNMTSGQCEAPKPRTKPYLCLENDFCNKEGIERRVLMRICDHFECRPRRTPLSGCAACKYDEYCNLRGECQVVLRARDFDCEHNSWFYLYDAYYCLAKIKGDYDEAKEYCERHNDYTLANGLKSPVLYGVNGVLFENYLIYYLSMYDGWLSEKEFNVQHVFPDWYLKDEQHKKSYFVCFRELKLDEIPINATKSKQRCQTLFVLRGNACYLTQFTNFMQRIRIKEICNMMDSDMLRIMSKEEARMAYGLAGGKSFWIGLKKEKRGWYWDGATYGYRARYFVWRTGQPEYTDGKVCAYSRHAGEWMSADCERFTEPRRFICQREAFKV